MSFFLKTSEDAIKSKLIHADLILDISCRLYELDLLSTDTLEINPSSLMTIAIRSHSFPSRTGQ